MPLINLILTIIILVGIIFIISRQMKIRKLDKKIEQNWKKIDEGREAMFKAVEEAEEMLGITGIKLDEKGE